MPSSSFRLEPLPGYAPTIGRLVGILLYARQTTLAAVEGLSVAELDHLQDDASNSIGALLRNKPLEHYVHELSEARRPTLEGLAARDDAWLEQSLRAAPAMNGHFAWFHVAEDEINHRGQIRWLRARLSKGTHSGAVK